MVAAPGTQILIPLLAALLPPGRAAVLAPTYAEHAPAGRRAGHTVEEVASLEQLRGAVLAIVVNPNNPDGRIVARDALLACAHALPARGLMVVDEAFMDAVPAAASLAGDVADRRLVVLRSFGKFFGLPGLRLGFALAPPDIAARLRATLGPWPVAGPALAVGAVALRDRDWIAATGRHLAQCAARLDRVLAGAGLSGEGTVPLFRLVRTPFAPDLFWHLGRAGILVRRFVDQATSLRFGLPGSETEWERLEAALAEFGGAPRADSQGAGMPVEGP